jgi:hypothetical protein
MGHHGAVTNDIVTTEVLAHAGFTTMFAVAAGSQGVATGDSQRWIIGALIA